jgi:hypothetical protein
MAEKNPMAVGAGPALSAAEIQELNDEALVLDRLLVHWPIAQQESDIQRELSLGEDHFDRGDRVERAVEELRGAGLALRCGPIVIPTRAAFHYRLLSEQATIDL